MRYRIVGLVIALLLAAGAPAAQQLDAGVTLQGTHGRFIFEDATTSWMMLASFNVQGGAWRLGASIPGIFQNSNAVSYVGGVPIGTGGPNGGTVAGRGSGDRIPGRRSAVVDGMSSATVVRGGQHANAMTVDSGFVEAPGAYRFTLGDPILSAGRDVWRSASGEHRVGVQAFAKLPLAPVSSGVGTGAADIGAALSTAATLGQTVVALDLSHWVIGDLPDLELRDISGATLGLGRAFGWSRQHSLMASYSASSAAVARTEAPQAVALGYGHLGADGRSLSIGVAHGLSESTADWTAWIGWRRTFGP